VSTSVLDSYLYLVGRDWPGVKIFGSDEAKYFDREVISFKRFNFAFYNKLVIPLLKDQHWICIIVDLQEGEIHYINSSAGFHIELVDKIRKFVCPKVLNAGIHVNRLVVKTKCPKQQNKIDCGIFVSQYVRFFKNGREPDFEQLDCKYFRLKMYTELMQGNFFKDL